jgi:hypothetical protein
MRWKLRVRLVGIEVPHRRPALVSLTGGESESFQRSIAWRSLGRDVAGDAVSADLVMPLAYRRHRRSGKSVLMTAVYLPAFQQHAG